MNGNVLAQATSPPSMALLAGLAALGLLGLLYVLYWRFRIRDTLLRQVAELEGLSQAGSALVAADLDVDALCELIYRESGQVIDNATFQVGLFEEDRYYIKVWVIDGERQTPSAFDLGERGGIVGWVRDTRRPLLIRDFEREMGELPARPTYIAADPPRSAIFLPLISGERVIGLMAAQSQQPDRFSADDLRRLTILGNQAASAIANAQLFEQERTRAGQLQLVSDIARQVSAINDLDDIFRQVVHLTNERFGYHPVSIFSYEPTETPTMSGPGEAGTADDLGEPESPDQYRVVIRASSGADAVAGAVPLQVGDSLIASAIQTRQTVVSPDVDADARYQPQLGLAQLDPLAAQTRSEIVIPLVVEGQVLGVLDVHSPEPAAFTAPARTALEALGAQVAIAINKAGQFRRQQEQAWLTTAQLQMAEALRRSADLDALQVTITRLTAMLVGHEFCAVMLWDEAAERYRAATLYAEHPERHQDFTGTSVTIGQWPALDAAHVGRQPLVTDQGPPWQKAFRPVALYPLAAKGSVMGMLVAGPPPAAGTAEELLRLIVSQSAQALDNALLAIAQQEEAWVNTALLQVAEAVNSLIDLQDILSTIVRFAPMLVGVNACLVLIWDEERQVFRPGPSHGIGDMSRGVLESFEIDRSEIVSLEQREDRLSPAPTYYEMPLPPWMQTAMHAERAVALPLVARGELVGALLVGAPSAAPLGGRRLSILAGIAHQAAIAVVNDQLYRESAERDKLAQELQLAHEIQASMIPPGNPRMEACRVASYWRAAREVSGDFYDFIRLTDGRWGIVIADVADKGMPAAIFMAVSRTILRAVAFSRVSPAATLRRVNDILLNDTTTDLFVTTFYAVWDPKANVLTYANAGHNPPILLRADGTEQLLRTSGIALGVLDDIVVGEQSVLLEPDDMVLMYTDGVTEAMNEDYDEFGLERLRLTLRGAREQPPSGIVAAVTEAVREHTGDATLFDDLTMVVIKRKPPAAKTARRARRTS